MKSEDIQSFLTFAGGLVLAAILCITYDVARFVPMAVAFGLLCFSCGALLTQFLSLRKTQEELIRRGMEDAGKWLKKFEEMEQKESDCEAEREKWEDERAAWEEEKEEWEGNKQQSVLNEIARLSVSEPEILLDFQRNALRLAEDEAARRGGEQIERDLSPDESEEDEEK